MFLSLALEHFIHFWHRLAFVHLKHSIAALVARAPAKVVWSEVHKGKEQCFKETIEYETVRRNLHNGPVCTWQRLGAAQTVTALTDEADTAAMVMQAVTTHISPDHAHHQAGYTQHRAGHTHPSRPHPLEQATPTRAGQGQKHTDLWLALVDMQQERERESERARKREEKERERQRYRQRDIINCSQKDKAWRAGEEQQSRSVRRPFC